jgi:hypothetical protein
MRPLYLFVISAFFVMTWQLPARADLRVGQKAELFRSVDENLQPVDMAKLIVGRPLILLVTARLHQHSGPG